MSALIRPECPKSVCFDLNCRIPCHSLGGDSVEDWRAMTLSHFEGTDGFSTRAPMLVCHYVSSRRVTRSVYREH